MHDFVEPQMVCERPENCVVYMGVCACAMCVPFEYVRYILFELNRASKTRA